jgi:hypothetical protein
VREVFAMDGQTRKSRLQFLVDAGSIKYFEGDLTKTLDQNFSWWSVTKFGTFYQVLGQAPNRDLRGAEDGVLQTAVEKLLVLCLSPKEQ